MAKKSKTDAYIAKCVCGGIIYFAFALEDIPNTRKYIAREVGELIRQGYEIERMSCAAVRKAKYCKNHGKCNG